MTKELCMLATGWQGQDPTGYLMSEKLDGIRMIRPLGSKVLLSREGNPFNPPKWWMDQLPQDIYLDGEGWAGRGMFQQTQRILQRPEPYDHEPWRHIRFMCIEPHWQDVSVGLLMARFANFTNEVFCIIKQTVCRSREHLEKFYDEIVEAGGEGVCLRHPNQSYHCGRSPYLLKIKPEKKTKAVVTKYNRDILGQLISLECGLFMPTLEPIYFDVSNGLTQATRANPPPLFSEVNVLFQCLTDAGKPRFAKLAKKL